MAATSDLVLIPGLLCTAELYAAQTKGLSKARIQVADHTGFDTMAAIARGILANAPATFALAGLSMGGYVAFEILRQAPQRVTKLCLLDTSARPDAAERAEFRRGLVDVARKHGLAAVNRQLIGQLLHPDRVSDPAMTRVIDRMAEAVGIDGFARQQEAIITRPDSRPGLPGITCPTLIIVGADDAITPVALHEEMARAIPGSQMQVVRHCGHLSTLERPETVTDLMADWLAA
jgi:pimeloyl-ACP methyl ester carboxylesterase